MALSRQVHSVVAESSKQAAVDQLILAYRRFGHYAANINPLKPASQDVRLSRAAYQLEESDMTALFLTRGLLNQDQATLTEIVQHLQSVYCGSVGYEINYIDNDEQRQWLQHYVETETARKHLSKDDKIALLTQLTAAAGLEKFLDSKYPGQKRFSNEGLDSLIPLVNKIAMLSAKDGVKEVKIGMAHRGRLNVLLNVMGKSSQSLFQEFDGTMDYGLTTGDVKYHSGFSSDVQTPYGPLHMSLAFNPSHLEFINPVVMGSIRSRQERRGGDNPNGYALGILIHGDSAFIGQGVVMETLSMAHTRAYDVGGSIHIVANNQIGFTTSNPHDVRSSHYCTDIAKMISAPIIHVNADDPEAVIAVAELALEFRKKFHRDIVIDLVGFRRHGHQEVDEPRATQPIEYQLIDKHQGVHQLYSKQLIDAGLISQSDVDTIWREYRDLLDNGKQTVTTLPEGLSQHYATNWTPYLNQPWTVPAETAVDFDTLKRLGEKLDSALPEAFTLQRNVAMAIKARAKMTQGEQALDWGYAETMAYATLLDQGVSVRLSGEDAERGTFFHRHAVLHDQVTGKELMPLQTCSSPEASVQIHNSLLSETAAMAFEYGYSIANPKSLVMWEAQFGDFANGAQVIIDQFISSGWQKWNRLSGVVLLLPHGYEGMGPEHSSARLERFLQLCAQENIQVCVPTTPSQIFHLLRRQVLRPYRKPLVVMSPKSLLRHKLAISSLEDLAVGCFQTVLNEVDEMDRASVKRILVCSGKVYYDLLQKRRDEKISDTAIVRLEQLYPFPYENFKKALLDFPNAVELTWCQEEPKNQGSWFITRRRLINSKPETMTLSYVCRPPSAAPAVGYPTLHKQQLAQLLDAAFNLNGEKPFKNEE